MRRFGTRDINTYRQVNSIMKIHLSFFSCLYIVIINKNKKRVTMLEKGQKLEVEITDLNYLGIGVIMISKIMQQEVFI